MPQPDPLIAPPPAARIPLLAAWEIDGLAHGFMGRAGGVSAGAYASFNLAEWNGDDPASVAENWRRFCINYPHLAVAREVVPHLVRLQMTRRMQSVHDLGAVERDVGQVAAFFVFNEFEIHRKPLYWRLPFYWRWRLYTVVRIQGPLNGPRRRAVRKMRRCFA